MFICFLDKLSNFVEYLFLNLQSDNMDLHVTQCPPTRPGLKFIKFHLVLHKSNTWL